MEEPEALEEHEVYPYTIHLVHTGRTLERGSRLRMVVSSALSPTFARNLNTGGYNELETDYVTADQRIYHGAEYPSHILLPVVQVSNERGGKDPGR